MLISRKIVTYPRISLAPKDQPLAYDLAGLHSLRTSDYRIIYRIREKKLIIIVIAVGHRREIYKKLKELIIR